MKSLFFAIIAALVCFTGTSEAQDLVFSGRVVGVSPENGTLILASTPAAHVTFSGLAHARIRTVDGRAVTLSQLVPGMRVSVAYAVAGKNWVVSRILIPAASAPEVAPVITDPRYKTLFDGDITTKPGSSAAVDGDITTKPPNSAAYDGDITTKAPGTANADGDITTKQD